VCVRRTLTLTLTLTVEAGPSTVPEAATTAGGPLVDWAEELLSALSTGLLTLVHGVQTLLGSAVERAAAHAKRLAAAEVHIPVESTKGISEMPSQR